MTQQFASPVESETEVAPWTRAQLLRSIVRLLLGVVLVLGLVAVAAHNFRAELEAVGRAFVEHLGYWGMGVGTLLADGFHFPVPPQFYMLLAISSGASLPIAMSVITAASLLGG